MKNPRNGTLHIGGQPTKRLGPIEGVATWTLCAGIGYDRVGGSTTHAEDCPKVIDSPVELGTLEP